MSLFSINKFLLYILCTSQIRNSKVLQIFQMFCSYLNCYLKIIFTVNIIHRDVFNRIFQQIMMKFTLQIWIWIFGILVLFTIVHFVHTINFYHFNVTISRFHLHHLLCYFCYPSLVNHMSLYQFVQKLQLVDDVFFSLLVRFKLL